MNIQLPNNLNFDKSCSLFNLFDILWKKWTIFILILLYQKIDNFSWIIRKLPKLNWKVLSDRLDLLIENWFVRRNVTNDKPLKINYYLTQDWLNLTEKLINIWNWYKTK